MFALIYDLVSKIAIKLSLFCVDHNYRFVPFKLLRTSKALLAGIHEFTLM